MQKNGVISSGKIIKAAAGELLFPGTCPVCGGSLPFETRLKLITGGLGGDEAYDAYICRECRAGLEYITSPFCGKCGRKLMQEDEEGLCSDCKSTHKSFDGCRSLMEYGEIPKEILMGLKYHGRKETAALLGLLEAEKLGGWIKNISPDIIIPVPVHEKRLKKRGYNQAGEIALALGKKLDIPVPADILRRSKNTAALKALLPDERLMSLQGAFIADSKKLAALIKYFNAGGKGGLTVLLADDIYTTGATMDECAAALKRAGVLKVYGICAAAVSDI